MLETLPTANHAFIRTMMARDPLLCVPLEGNARYRVLADGIQAQLRATDL